MSCRCSDLMRYIGKKRRNVYPEVECKCRKMGCLRQQSEHPKPESYHPPPPIFNPLLCCLIFPICEMETIPLSFVLLCPEELEWARPFKRTLKTDYWFSLLCATLPTMKRYLRKKVQFCFAKKAMLTFHQKHLTALIVRWKSAVFDRAICKLCQCYVVLHHQPGPGVLYFFPYFLWGIMCCDFDLGHFLSSGGLSSSCFSASTEYHLQPKKYDFLLLKWVRPFWFFNHKQWSSEKKSRGIRTWEPLWLLMWNRPV